MRPAELVSASILKAAIYKTLKQVQGDDALRRFQDSLFTRIRMNSQLKSAIFRIAASFLKRCVLLNLFQHLF